MGSSSTREESIARMADVMRDFMANAVLFQDAVARTGGLNSTDLQAVGLLMSQGPATPGELAERTGLSAGGAITAVIDRLEKAGYVGPIYGRVGARWATYLDTLSDDQIELANELFTRASEINREEIELLREQR